MTLISAFRCTDGEVLSARLTGEHRSNLLLEIHQNKGVPRDGIRCPARQR
jgi:hypothetical protein